MWMQQQEEAYLRSLPSHNLQQQTFHPGIVTDNRVQQQQQQQQSHHHHHHHHHRSTMDLSLPSNPRASRNMAEKQRRDNLNTNISAMATLLPTVAESPRKMDKISILRLAAAFLRMQRALGKGSADFLPRELGDLDLEHYIIDNVIKSGGFFIVTTTTGKIVYVSRQVEQHLGHARTELLGQSLYSFVHADDHDRLTKNITPDEMQATVSSTTAQITEVTNDNSNSSEDLTSQRKKMPFREQRRSFEIRMLQRSVSRREHTQYEFLDISGILRLADACKSSEANGSRTSYREVNSTSNDIVFVGLARLLKKRPITELSIIDANKDEYVTRHLVDGRIIYCDHRVSVVAGYLSEEVSGLSAFSFMHKDDFRWPMIGLRQMYDRAETCGSSCYRLLSKTGDFIYLRTHGYLEYDKNTQTVESFVCVNTLVSEEEGIELVREMKKRYSATVSETARAMIQTGEEMSFDLDSDSQLSNSKSSLEDPSQLEDAITHLISDLPSPAISEDRLSPSPLPNAQFAKAAIVAQRLPAVSTQASKVGIKKIDHYLILQGKGNRTPKQEAKVDNSKQSQPSGNSKIDHSRAIEHQPSNDVQARNKLTEQDSPRPSGKSTSTILKASSQSHNVQDDTNKDTIPRQINILSPIDPAVETCLNISNEPGTSQLDDPCDGNILNTGTPVDGVIKDLASSTALHENNPCELKLDHAIDILKRYEDQEPVMGYIENGVIDDGMTSDTETKSHYSLKRICSDEDIRTSCNKKRHSDVFRMSNDTHDEHLVGNYVNCRSFERDEEFSGIANDFQYNGINCQSLKIVDSQHSNINKVNQQLHPSVPLVVSNANDEQFVGQRDFKCDQLLGPGLDAKPDVIMKIFDDLMSGRIFNKTFNGTKVQQLGDNNAINNEIKWTHLQLANSIALQESQLNVLARDLEDPALHAQREDFTELKAEHNMQKQILQTLQQDHHNM